MYGRGWFIVKGIVVLFSAGGLVFAQDPKALGEDWGNKIRSVYEGKGNFEQNIKNPAETGKGYTQPSGKKFDSKSITCTTSGGTEEILKISGGYDFQSGQYNVAVSYKPVLGGSWSSQSFSFKYLCNEGYCNSYSNGVFSDCGKVVFSSGAFSVVPVSELKGCSLYPVDVYSFGIHLASLLVESYGGNVVLTKDVKTGNQISYSVARQVCSSSNPPQASYMANPYRITDDSIYRQALCSQQPDLPECKALTGMQQAIGATNVRQCILKRELLSSISSQQVCVPNARLYPEGYNESQTVCGNLSDFFAFSTMLFLECNPQGTGYVLKGYAFKEGYYDRQGRYSADVPPPPPYPLEVPISVDRSYNWTPIGSLSTGNGTFTVSAKNTYNPSDNSNIFEVSINSNSCNYFRWTLTRPTGEIFTGCEELNDATKNCVPVNIWWRDAGGKEYQIVSSGKLLEKVAYCQEVVRDESMKRWESRFSTAQSPPQNCGYPPKTCMPFENSYECRTWWSQRIEYQCVSDTSSYSKHLKSIDLTRVSNVLGSISENGNTFSWGENCGKVCPEGQLINGQCIRQKNPLCSSPYQKIGSICGKAPDCPQGMTYNPATDRCEGFAQCSPDQVFDPSINQCRPLNPTTVIDKEGREFNISMCNSWGWIDPGISLWCKVEGSAPYNMTFAYLYTGPLSYYLYRSDDPLVGIYWNATGSVDFNQQVCRSICDWGYCYSDCQPAYSVSVYNPTFGNTRYGALYENYYGCYYDMGDGIGCGWLSSFVSYYLPALGKYLTQKNTMDLGWSSGTNPASVQGSIYVQGGFYAYTMDATCCNSWGSYSFIFQFQPKPVGPPTYCPNGTYDASVKKCIASAVCPDGGTLNAYSDLCEKPFNKACPDGWLEGATSCVSEPQSVCQGGGTSSYPKGTYSGKQYCVVKYINSQNRREYDTRECNPNCPVNAGEELVEPCKEKPMSGFTVATGVLSVIREALRDKICGR